MSIAIRTLLLFLSSLFFQKVISQIPEITIDGKKDSSIYLKKYSVNVKVTGSLSFTSIEMQFCNRSARILEAELNMVLPDGVNVSNYALDINGKMREAVPIEKEKGTQVFESIERKRVDPGLLEKVAGNTFRTRIYPVNPNSCRTIRIGYTQQLVFSNNNALTYNLPLNFTAPIENFSVDFKVFSNSNPEIISDCKTSMQFIKAEEVYNSHIEKNNFIPEGNFKMVIPKMTGDNEIQTQQSNGKNYFLLNSYLQSKEKKRTVGNKIGIIWDASLSGRNRDQHKEFELLDSLFQHKSNATIQVFTIADAFKKIASINISNGNTEELKKILKEIKFDGAGELNKINVANIIADEFYLFSDGFNSFSDDDPKFGQQPLFCINTAINSNYQQLKKWSGQTGGQYINLNELFINDAIHLIETEQYQLISIKGTATEIYPQLPTRATANICIAGIIEDTHQQLTLQFGYGNKITEETTITIDGSNNSSDLDIEKIWAQKKISFLETETGNKEQITILGKRYGIVTAGTSLIVLENVNDYIRYKIEPPAELRTAYDDILKRTNNQIVEAKNRTLENAIRSTDLLKQWRDKDKIIIKPKIVKPLPVKHPQAIVSRPPVRINNSVSNRRDTSNRSRVVTGRVTDDAGNPTPFASIRIKGTKSGVAADAAGTYTITAQRNDIFEIASVGFKSKNVAIGSNLFLNTVLEKNGVLSEVVVTGAFQTRRTQRSSGSVQTVREAQLDDVRQTDINAALAGKVAGAQINGQNTVIGYARSVKLRGENSITSGQPLWVIDGVVVDNTNDLDQTEIEDVNVLQGPAASGLFGPAGANGAVIINLKKDHRYSPSPSTDTTRRYNINVPTAKTLAPPSSMSYLQEMELENAAGYYNKYLSLRENFASNPVFYFDMANFFFAKNDKQTGLQILYDLAELNFEDAGLYKMLGYKLKEQGDFEKERYVFKKVLQWRPHEPQSYRDYALALADLGHYQEALDTLYLALNNLYENDIMNDYNGIEEIIVTEINALLSKHHLNKKQISEDILINNPVDVRIVLNWNMNDTDIDLWVTDSDEEKCFYGNKATKLGGRMSNDFTKGYGPEQFLLKKAKQGRYKIEINYFGDSQKKIAGPTTIMAEIYSHYGMPNESKKIVTLQMKAGSQGANFVGLLEF